MNRRTPSDLVTTAIAYLIVGLILTAVVLGLLWLVALLIQALA